MGKSYLKSELILPYFFVSMTTINEYKSNFIITEHTFVSHQNFRIDLVFLIFSKFDS